VTGVQTCALPIYDGDFRWKTDNNVWMNMGWYQGKNHKFPKYLIEAFKIAKEIGGPTIKYIYNQWGNATIDSKMGDACYKLYFALKEEGIVLDGMGIQLHCALKKGKLFEQPGGENIEFDFNSFKKQLNEYKEKNINVHITEFDIALSENPSSEELEKQGKYYAEVMKYSLLSSAVKTFKFWGISDKYSWIRHSLPYQASPLLYDTNFNPKPALLYLKSMLHNELKVSNH
jgi:endo-1,4-beta-xylanase